MCLNIHCQDIDINRSEAKEPVEKSKEKSTVTEPAKKKSFSKKVVDERISDPKSTSR
jgi:hypothetical protein